MAKTATRQTSEGVIVQVIGPSVDVRFPAGKIPKLYDAIHIEREGADDLVLEVALHIGDNMARCIALSGTDGLVRGMKARDTGNPIHVPVGDQTLGRIFDFNKQITPPGQEVHSVVKLHTVGFYQFTIRVKADKFYREVQKIVVLAHIGGNDIQVGEIIVWIAGYRRRCQRPLDRIGSVIMTTGFAIG